MSGGIPEIIEHLNWKIVCMYNGCEASTRQTFALAIPEIFA